MLTGLSDLPDVMTPSALAEATGVPRRSIYDWIAKGRLKAFRFGRCLYIRKDALEGMLTTEEMADAGMNREYVRATLEELKERIDLLLKGL